VARRKNRRARTGDSRRVARTGSPGANRGVLFEWNASDFKIPIPKDEKGRLADLASFEILDTPPEENFDNIALLAAHICGTPIALISLIDSDRQWFKSKVGTRLSETPRNVAFCAHAIMHHDLLIVPDAAKDRRFVTNPLVTGSPRVRFYAGAPLITPDAHVLGTLCVMDRVPRQLSAEQTRALRALSQQVMAQLDIRRRLLKMRRSLAHARQTEKDLRQQVVGARRLAEAQGDLLLRLSRQLRRTVESTSALIGRALAGELTAEQGEWLAAARSSSSALTGWANDIQRFCRNSGANDRAAAE
jgi:GAF domain-containing protein